MFHRFSEGGLAIPKPMHHLAHCKQGANVENRSMQTKLSTCKQQACSQSLEKRPLLRGTRRSGSYSSAMQCCRGEKLSACCQYKLLRMRMLHLLALCHAHPWLPCHGLCLSLFYSHLLCRSCLSELMETLRLIGNQSRDSTSSCCDTSSKIAMIHGHG